MPRGKKEKMSLIQKDPIYSSDDFRMYCFKVMPCSKHYTHDWTECPFAHPDEKATRRDPRLFTYVGIDCPNAKNEGCPQGDQCPFAHNVFECWLHPSRYRTQMCNEPMNCKRKVCFFAHTAEELRQPTAVSQDIDVGNFIKTKHMSISPERRRPAKSPPPDYRRQSYDGLKPKGQILVDHCSRRRTSMDLPPRPRASVDGLNRSVRHQSPGVVSMQQPSASQQMRNQSVLLEQLQAISAFNQQQQQTLNSLDLAALLDGLSLTTTTGNHPSVIPSSMTINSGLETNNNAAGLQQQTNALLLALLQQQLQNSNSTNPAQAPATGIPPPPPVLNNQFQNDRIWTENHTASNPSTITSTLTHPFLLQQLRQLQMNQGMGSFASGLRSSLDSSLSNGSTGSRIPTRVSYDAMSSTLSPALQRLAELGSLPPGISENLSAPDFILTGTQPRSSTESSYTDSFGQWSIDPSFLEALKQTDLTGLGKSEAMVTEQTAAEDFISFNQGSETFASANANLSDPQGDAVQVLLTPTHLNDKTE
eukprot:g6863.t1